MDSQLPLFEELEAFLEDLVRARAKFAGSSPPVFASLTEADILAAEFSARHAVDYALRDWFEYGKWRSKFSDTTRFWLWARFEHGHFFLGCLAADNGSGLIPCLPTDDTGQHMVDGLMEWLLIHSWHFSGAQRWCREFGLIADVVRSDRKGRIKLN